MRFSRLLSASLVVLVGVTAVAHGQQVGDKKGLEAAYNNAAIKRYRELAAGEDQPRKDDAKVIEAAAQWHIYRITHRTFFKTADVQKEFNDRTIELMEPSFKDGAKKVKENRAFVKLYGPKLVEAMRTVLTANPVATEASTAINAAMMLSSMARLKEEKINEFLADELVKNTNTHDVIRLYAIKALREALPVTIQPDAAFALNLNDKDQNAKRASDAKVVDALTEFIEDPAKRRAKLTTPEDIATIRYMRREAIIALAQAGAPAVLAVNKKQVKDELKGPVAPTLLKVLSKTDLQPPPSLQEKIEAVIGLCSMRYPNVPEYDPNVATYLIGRTILEFVDDYNKDLGSIGLVGPGQKLPYIAYKTDAERMNAALNEFAKNANSPNATSLKSLAQPVLKSMTEKAGPKLLFPQPNLTALAALRQALPSWRPKASTAFKTLKTPAISLD